MSLAIASILKEEDLLKTLKVMRKSKKYLLMSLKYIGKRETLLFVKLNE
jgi:hypothetical protein